jgi:tetratricopeptide (TPR) repeat protein
MLAELAGRIGRYPDAEKLLRHALELAPGFRPARFNLATLYYRSNEISSALAQLDQLLSEEPENPAYRNLMAVVLTRAGELEDAIVHFERVLDRQPGQKQIWLSYGHTLKTMGRQADGITAYRKATEIEPGFGEAWWSLANLKTVRFDAADISTMEQALAGEAQDQGDRLHLHFALAKAIEDKGDDDAAAFAHYAEGNRLRLEQEPYDPQVTTNQVDKAIELFTPEFLAERAGLGSAAPDPIFVLGMPRAGSTLVEQILASHPAIEGTHELPDIQMIVTRLGGEDKAYHDKLRAMSQAQLAALGDEYVERTRKHRRQGRPRFIDKMPNNWLNAGLIRVILPNAKIIDARRHPLAACVANFRQHFARGQKFSYNLEHMGLFYRDYVRLMAHYDAVDSGMVHRVHYEAMVGDTEAEVRRLLDFLGLPFDEACLRFHETERAVRTASSEQVRQPIFKEGLDHWRRYEEWLGPLKTILENEIADYPRF